MSALGRLRPRGMPQRRARREARIRLFYGVSLRSSPTLVRHALTIKSELIAPILSVERPELVLFIHDDLTLTLSGDIRGGLRLGAEALTLRGQDLELDGVDLVRKVLELIDKTSIAAASKITGLVDGVAPRDLDIGEDAHADARVLEFVRHLLEALALLIEHANIGDVREDRAIGERAPHDTFDIFGEHGVTGADIAKEFEEGDVIAIFLEDLVELSRDRIVAIVEFPKRREGVIVLAVHEEGDGLDDVRLGIIGAAEEGGVQAVDVAERAAMVVRDEERP